MSDSLTPLTEAQEITQEFTQFVYLVSHDLNTPVRGMVEFSKLLKAEEITLSDNGKEYLSLIIESGEMLKRMMAGLLEYSRLSTMSKPMSKVSCNSILSDCQVVLKNKIRVSNAHLEVASLPIVTADAEQLMQVFLMLLDNALKFHPVGSTPEISISVQKNDAEWLFTIQDNGIGIEEKYYTHIFKPFKRLHTESEYLGIGMGLTLVKKIVERHGGKIWVHSIPEQGTSFCFTLPCPENNA